MVHDPLMPLAPPDRRYQQRRNDKPSGEENEQRCAPAVGAHDGEHHERGAKRDAQADAPNNRERRVTFAAPLDPDLAEYEGSAEDEDGESVRQPHSKRDRAHEQPKREPQSKASATNPWP